MTAAGASYIRCAGRSDTFVSRELTQQCIATYAADTDPHHPMLSPIHGRFTGLPLILLQISEDDAMYDDSVLAASVAQQQDCQIEVQTWGGVPHMWHLLAPRLPEASAAIHRIGQFINKVVGHDD